MTGFHPGFRLNVLDAAVLGAGAVSAVLAFLSGSLPLAIAGYVIFTFFLYCNVFRIRRTSELIWAAVFTAAALCSFWLGSPSWTVTFSAGLLTSVVLIGIEMRHPSYHGIGWRLVNPDLPSWWRQRNPPENGSESKAS